MKTRWLALLVGGAAGCAFLVGRSGDVRTAEAQPACSEYSTCSGSGSGSDRMEAFEMALGNVLSDCNSFYGAQVGCCSNAPCSTTDQDDYFSAYCTATPFIRSYDACSWCGPYDGN
jgi:hypothetical protein